jgi:multiple sugar transport system ATP-binding protein
MAAVRLVNLTKRFGDVVAVSNMSLEIRDGEFLVLVGPSGCGKTTCLRMIAGLEEPTEGEIWIGDRLVNDVSPKDRNIAMVFQNYALYPHMTAYDNMAFALRLRKVPKKEIDARVRQAAAMLGIEDLLSRRPRELSGGQRQRVAVGRAIVREPAVFLMDEPLSNLDAKMRVETRAELIKLHRRLGVTTVYVTHDQLEAMTMGDRIVVMNGGIVQQVDTPLGLYYNPANVFVAGFIGTPPMNLLDATIVAGAEGISVSAGDFQVTLPFSKATLAEPYAGSPVILGIRPNDIYPRTSSPDVRADEGAGLRALVEVVEPMGAEAILYLSVGGTRLVASVDSMTPARENASLDLLIDTDRVHLFDKATGQAIVTAATGNEALLRGSRHDIS